MAPKRKANGGSSSTAGDQNNWASLTVVELVTEVSARGLSHAGKKADLVARLQSNDDDAATLMNQAARIFQAVDDFQAVGISQAKAVVDWMTRTVPQLKSALTARNHSVTGKKADLVARLEGADRGEPVEASRAAKRAKTVDSIVPEASSSTAAAAPKRKTKKKGVPADVDIEGPLAKDVIAYKHSNPETGERRQREFIPEPDDKFKATYWRISNERMFMLDRGMSTDQKGHACQVFDIAGSTGNVYNVSIGRSPKCNCPDAKIRGQKCKHINYALIVILKVPIYLSYQLAFLSEELDFIFASAPVTSALEHNHHEHESPNDGTRKPIEGECCICVFPMSPEEELVWCKAACGQNFHQECFEQWKRSKHGGRVTCVYCRTEWLEAGPKKGSLAQLASTAPIVGSYRNIGDHQMYQEE